MRTYLIEPQLMFADYLRGFLSAAGFAVVATHHDIGATPPREVRLTP